MAQGSGDNLDESGGVSPRPGFGRELGVAVRRARRSVLDLFLPPVCLGCDQRLTEHDALCPTCWRKIDFIRQPLCDRLGAPLPYDTGGVMLSAAAMANPPDYGRARAVACFDGLMRDLIHALKFSDTHDARRLFGRWLANAGEDLLRDADILVPVPLAWSRLLSRRYNQAQILAQATGEICGLPVVSQALIRKRRTGAQVGLTRAARRRNVSGAFAVPPSACHVIAGKAIVLVDDVITTGATASAAARALRRAGARSVDVLALAIVTEHGHIA